MSDEKQLALVGWGIGGLVIAIALVASIGNPDLLAKGLSHTVGFIIGGAMITGFMWWWLRRV